ncbi:MAG: ABC transporter substrate-binding protein [Rhodospirillaceae bacterium]|nr:ABC transporter substrate-binding protein [Rhodospirillaceae bacterium]
MKTKSYGACAVGLIMLGLSSESLARKDNIIDVVCPWEIGSADATKSGHVFRWMSISETLVGVNPDGSMKPLLATAWSVDDSRLVWRFHIREGVKFHNGKPLTAAAAAFSLNAARSKPGVLAKSPIKEIKAEGSDLVVVLNEPFSPLPSLFTHASSQILDADSYDAAGNAVKVIGTGPFAITLLQTPQRLAGKTFADYWGPKTVAEGITYLAAPRSETRTLMVQSGDADLAFNMDAASLKRLEMTAPVKGFSIPVARTITLKLNAARPGLDTARGRNAINAVIDRQGIAASILREPKSIANQQFSPMFGDWFIDGLPPFRYDPKFTRAEFKAMGWSEDAEGYLAKDGKRLSLILTTFSDRPELPIIATSIQESLRQAGIEAKVSVNNSSAIPAGHHDGSLDMGMLARNYGVVRDPFVVVSADFRSGGGDWGAMNWGNAELDDVMTKMRSSDGGAEYKILSQRAARIIHDEMPVIPIAWHVQTVAVSKDIENFALDPFQLTWNLEKVTWAK